MDLSKMDLEALLQYMQAVWLYCNEQLKKEINDELRKRGQNV